MSGIRKLLHMGPFVNILKVLTLEGMSSRICVLFKEDEKTLLQAHFDII